MRSLREFVDSDELSKEEINWKEGKLLRDMVCQNILYYDPREAMYYPRVKAITMVFGCNFKKKKGKEIVNPDFKPTYQAAMKKYEDYTFTLPLLTTG